MTSRSAPFAVVNNTRIYINFSHNRGDMHQDRPASNDAQVVRSGLYVGVDGQAGVRDDIGIIARRTFNP